MALPSAPRTMTFEEAMRLAPEPDITEPAPPVPRIDIPIMPLTMRAVPTEPTPLVEAPAGPVKQRPAEFDQAAVRAVETGQTFLPPEVQPRLPSALRPGEVASVPELSGAVERFEAENPFMKRLTDRLKVGVQNLDTAVIGIGLIRMTANPPRVLPYFTSRSLRTHRAQSWD